MNKKKTIILLVIGIMVVTISSIGITYSYMKPKADKTNNETEIGINNCAKITLKDNDSTINLINMYPMEEEMGLQTIPYEFTISSTCEEYTGFNLYLTTLTDNEIEDNQIRYAVTDEDNNVLITDLLTNKNEKIDLTEEEIKELEQGIENKRGNTYKVYNGVIPLNKDKVYKLHLWLDENANNETMNQSFKIKVSIKGYKYEGTLAEYLIKTKDRSLIYHDGKPDYEGMENYELEAGDLSYRFTGSDYKIKDQYKNTYSNTSQLIITSVDSSNAKESYTIKYDNTVKNSFLEAVNKTIVDGYVEKDEIKNYVCFNSNENPCPESNLYRIIGIIDKKLKLIKATIATSKELGTTGAYKENNFYVRNSLGNSNAWADSNLNTENLNNYYLNTYLLPQWRSKIAENIIWKVGKNSWDMMVDYDAKIVYNEELITNSENYNLGQIGLMYVSDYMYSVSPNFWSYRAGHISNKGNSLGKITGESWLYLNGRESTISCDETNVLIKYEYGSIGSTIVNSSKINGGLFLNIRPTFFLKEDVNLISGTGTSNNPYQISL